MLYISHSPSRRTHYYHHIRPSFSTPRKLLSKNNLAGVPFLCFNDILPSAKSTSTIWENLVVICTWQWNKISSAFIDWFVLRVWNKLLSESSSTKRVTQRTHILLILPSTTKHHIGGQVHPQYISMHCFHPTLIGGNWCDMSWSVIPYPKSIAHITLIQ